MFKKEGVLDNTEGGVHSIGIERLELSCATSNTSISNSHELNVWVEFNFKSGFGFEKIRPI